MLPLDVITGAILVISLASLTLSLPEGPPLRACHRMLPGVKVGQRMQEGHTARAQNEWPTGGFTRQPPYYIQMTGGKSYQPNQRFQSNYIIKSTKNLKNKEVICYNPSLTLFYQPISICQKKG